jgi:hypothetical protein
MTPLLAPFAHMRDKMTVVTGLQHMPGKLSHHASEYYSFLGALPNGRFKHSLDQVAADTLGAQARVRNLALEISAEKVGYQTSGSFKNGLPITQIKSPQTVFKMLFGKLDEKKEREIIAMKRSMLDLTLAEAKSLRGKVSARDRERLEEYFTSVRESEAMIEKEIGWLGKDRVELDFGKEMAGIDKTDEIMFQLIYLAFKYDVTRVISCQSRLSHGNSHAVGSKGLVTGNVAYLTKIAALFDKLSTTKSPTGGNLMDETATVLTAALSISKKHGAHNGENPPVMMFGGGMKHGTYIRYDNPKSVCNTFLTALQHLGVETSTFGSSSGTLRI